MGALYGQRCFSTNAQAADAFFTGAGPSYTAGSTSYQSWYEKSGATWQIKRQSISSTGAVTNLTASTATIPTFPSCTESAPFYDGIAIGWGVAAAMAAAWGVKFLSRTLSR